MIPIFSRWLLQQPARGARGRLNVLRRAFATATTETTATSSPGGVVLRDYQEDCIKSVLSSIDQGHKRVGISLATGSGKTVIFTQLIGRVSPSSEDADQTLILAHRRELVEQAAKHCTNTYPDKIVEVEMGNIHASGYADITVASIQSITSKGRLDKFDPSRFKLVLVDEAHHIVASTYLKTLEYFSLHEKIPDSPTLVGVSATFSRFDGLALGKVIDEIVYHKDYIDMIGDKWLSNVLFTTVQSTANLTEVRTAGKNGDFVTSELSRAVNTPEVNAITVATWQAKAYPHRQSTLVFCVDVDHIQTLTATFRERGLDARYITGSTKAVVRAETLAAFKNKEFPILVNCGVFTEGTDIPNIDCILMCRPTRSQNLLIQMIGRGMRLHEDKKDCHIIDMVSTLDTGIITTPTLFGLDPDEILDAATPSDMQKHKAEAEALSAKKAKVTFGGTEGLELSEYASVLDLIRDQTPDKHIRAISRNSWVAVDEDKFILAGPTGTYLRLEKATGSSLDEIRSAFPHTKAVEEVENTAAFDTAAFAETSEDEDLWNEQVVTPRYDAGKPSKEMSDTHFTLHVIKSIPMESWRERPRRGGPLFASPRLLLAHVDFGSAVRGADLYASKVFPQTFTRLRAGWRNRAPTEGQLAMINGMRKFEKPLTAQDVTKGVASDMITKLKHGAKKRYKAHASQRQAAQKKAEKQAEKKAALTNRASVKVGPTRASSENMDSSLKDIDKGSLLIDKLLGRGAV